MIMAADTYIISELRLHGVEEEKTLPFGAVYDYFNLKNNIPVGEEYIADIEKYEAEDIDMLL